MIVEVIREGRSGLRVTPHGQENVAEKGTEDCVAPGEGRVDGANLVRAVRYAQHDEVQRFAIARPQILSTGVRQNRRGKAHCRR